jgi:hypothetical protein
MPRYKNVDHARIREGLKAISRRGTAIDQILQLEQEGFDDVARALRDLPPSKIDEIAAGGAIPQDLRE